jgi:hypothetical protein
MFMKNSGEESQLDALQKQIIQAFHFPNERNLIRYLKTQNNKEM